MFSRRPGPRFTRGRIAAGGGAAEETPATIMGAKWVECWRAELGVTIASGVSQWTGQVGGKNWSQGTAGAQPAFNAAGGPNSTPSIALDGIDDFMDCDALVRAVPTAVLWMIARQTIWTSGDSLINDASATLVLLQQLASPNIRMFAGTGVNIVNLAVGTFGRIQAEFTASTSDRLLIVATSATGASAGTVDGTQPLLGRNAASTTFGAGEFCEIAFFNAIPTAGQQSSLNAYVTSRYGAGLV